MNSIAEPIIAGSRGFALALLAPLTEKIGTRPRIATDPVAAGAFCVPGGGLVVVEYLGTDTMRGVEALLGAAKGVRVVVAVPEKHAAADAPLRALGAEVTRWTGATDPIVAAVGRQRAPAAPPPRASPEPPRAPTAPPPRAPTPAAGVAAPKGPAAASPPAPERGVVPEVASLAAATPARAAPAPAPPAAAAPPAAPPVTPVATGRSQAPAPRPSLTMQPAQPAAAGRASSSPSPDRAPAVAPASRAVVPAHAVASAAQPPAPPPPAPQPVPAAARASMPRPAAGPATAARPPAPPWPSMIPDAADAAEALQRAVSGSADAAVPGLAEVLARVLGSLSALEREVLAGKPQQIDPRPIRDAAVMRVRVGAALATVPPAGSEVDAAAVSSLLGEMDALLSQVSTAAAEAPPGGQQALEAVRNALVREAIDFSEAAQRVGAGAPAEEPGTARPAVRQPHARLISIDAVAEPPSTRPRRFAVVLAVAVLAVGGYRAWQWYELRARRAAALHKPGLPAGFIEVRPAPGTPRTLVHVRTDEAPDAAEIQRFRAIEEAKGNVVRENDGILYVMPGPPGGGIARPAPPSDSGAPGAGEPAGQPAPPAADRAAPSLSR